MFYLVTELISGIPDNVVGLIITGIFGVIVAAGGWFMASRGRRLGSRESRAPDVEQMWAQQEADRRTRQLVEDMWWTLRRMFQAYYRRVTSTADSLNLPADVKKKFELTARERAAINAHLPEEGDQE